MKKSQPFGGKWGDEAMDHEMDLLSVHILQTNIYLNIYVPPENEQTII